MLALQKFTFQEKSYAWLCALALTLAACGVSDVDSSLPEPSENGEVRYTIDNAKGDALDPLSDANNSSDDSQHSDGEVQPSTDSDPDEEPEFDELAFRERPIDDLNSDELEHACTVINRAFHETYSERDIDRNCKVTSAEDANRAKISDRDLDPELRCEESYQDCLSYYNSTLDGDDLNENAAQCMDEHAAQTCNATTTEILYCIYEKQTQMRGVWSEFGDKTCSYLTNPIYRDELHAGLMMVKWDHVRCSIVAEKCPHIFIVD